MYTKKILSAAAAVAVVSTGVMAFDADPFKSDRVIKETGPAYGKYIGTNIQDANTTINPQGPGKIGDALIFPAFYGDKGWESEFSVINTDINHSVVAKVVLYSAIDSKELRDFNIYLSANDVFRAKLANGRLITVDGSTVSPGSDKTSGSLATGYTDTAKMVSKDNVFDIAIDPDNEDGTNKDAIYSGYIAVYAMTMAENSYHKQHKALWQDYRHLLDSCRSTKDEWRSGIQDGIYSRNEISVPDVNASKANCSIVSSVLDIDDDEKTNIKNGVYRAFRDTDDNVTFISPTKALTGSLLLSNSGDDGKGQRDMLVKAFAIDNFTAENQMLLWTEGEFAHIADRCIEHNATAGAHYNETCVQKDANTLRTKKVLYEFMDNTEGKLVVTQPYKRILIQLDANNSATGTSPGVTDAWLEITRGSAADHKEYLVTNYGGFTLSSVLYNDEEENYVPTQGGFTISPATSGTTDLIDKEMSLFNPLPSGSLYEQGYAWLTIGANAGGVPAIVTQMAAVEKANGTAETNWIYPFTTQD